MLRFRRLVSNSGIAIALGGLLAAAALAQSPAESNGLSKSERVRQLIPVYRAAVADPALAALAAKVDPRDRASVDAWLRAMPLSPLDYHEITRHLQRSEHPLRKPTLEFHQRWLALHPEEGRRLYGDEAVDDAVRGYGIWPETELQSPGAPVRAEVETASAAAATVGVNRNVAADAATEPDEYQGEIQLVVDPDNPQRMVAAANTWDDMGGNCGALGMQAVFYTTNGGTTWSYTCSPDESDFAAAFPGFDCPGGYPYDFGSDPALAWGPDGNVYLEYMLICVNGTFNSYRYSIVVADSADGGATWAPKGIVKDSLDTALTAEDKNFYAIDDFTSSPFFGRHYTCWDRNNDEKMAYSSNAGGTWTEVDLPTPAEGNTDIGCDLTVRDDGTVHVVWNRLSCPPEFEDPCTGERMYHSKSIDGGAHWSAPVLVHSFLLVGFSGTNCASAQNERCLNSFGSLDVDNSGGPCRGTLFVAFTDIPSGASEPKIDKSNVYVRTSSNGGATWSALRKINSDDKYALTTQFHPWLNVDRGNQWAVAAWHDTRNTGNVSRVNFFVGRSEDCGVTWLDEQVSAESPEFYNQSLSYSNESIPGNPNANPNQYGEYLGLDVNGGRALVAWTDSRQFFPAGSTQTQKENVGFVEVKFEEIFLDGFETGDARVWTAEVEE